MIIPGCCLVFWDERLHNLGKIWGSRQAVRPGMDHMSVITQP
jgi:hypothetical protein